jgi:uncharacterized protein YecT (DUF1311 family)
MATPQHPARPSGWHAAHALLLCLALLCLPLLLAGRAGAAEPDCGNASTQAAMNQCAQQAFEAASAEYAGRYAALSALLPGDQRIRLRRMQAAWIAYRTAACRYEAGPSNGGSAQGLVYWQCAARLTQARAAELAALATCREGDIGCALRRP